MIETILADLTLNITDGKHGDCQGEDSSGFYFISCKDVKDGQINYSDARQITEKDFLDAHKRTMLEPNDILVTNSGTIGRMAFIKDTPETYRTTFQKSVAVVKPDIEKVLPLYLYYQLQNCVADFINQSNGSAQKNLLLSTMRAFKLHIHATKKEQQHIADILSAYDNLIENNQKQIKLLEEAAQRLYREWFVDLRFPGYETTPVVDGVPEGWHGGTLKKLIDINYGKDHKNAPDDGDIPVYGSGGLIRKCNKSLFTGEAVLIPRKGSLNHIMYVNEPFWTVDTMFYATEKQECTMLFVYFFVSSHDMYAMNIGAAVPSMTVKILETMSLLIPSSGILERFNDIAKMYFQRIAVLNKQIERLAEARDRLLPKLMSGELEV